VRARIADHKISDLPPVVSRILRTFGFG
jgi:hypothetical protein